MEDVQSTIDSLRELNAKLKFPIVELRKKNAKLLNKEAGFMTKIIELKQFAKENTELKTRFEKLEKKNKTDTVHFITKNIELKDRVTKIEQNISTKDISQCSELLVTSQLSIPPPTEEHSIDSVSLEKNSGNNPKKIKNISDNTSSHKLDDFLYEKNKKSISNMIRKKNQEKKIQAQVSHNASSVPADSLCNKILDTETEEEPCDLENKQGLMQELSQNTPNVKINESYIQNLDNLTSDKTARTKLYKEMKPFLPHVTDLNLRKKTQRTWKILKLFGEEEVGIAKIKQVTYSASTISELTNAQIQNIIDYKQKNIDYYGVNAESPCPICKLNHEDEDGINGEYKNGSYYIKCEASGINIIILASK
ncbi:hypothetical protein Glove_443g48 [Diversispora epigaea]|uniref:Uncharacterized protein n=1 Tax=Diversispora epigaea TaxID=1348612 RepID=A0A397GQL1_9GLOM|nr:hypothetical protein Glove_443g48 [Diversispora epigaea]